MDGGEQLTDGTTTLFELRDDRGSLAIAPDIGGAIAWFRWDRAGGTIDWMRPADEEALHSRDVGRMACFPLVPYSNRIRDGRFIFSGQTVQLPVSRDDPHCEHGHGWRRPWTVALREPSRAVICYHHEADAWPWGYEAEQDFQLIEGALEVRLTLRNTSVYPMPAGLGLHPHFPTSPMSSIETVVHAMWETDVEVLPTHRVKVEPEQQTFHIAGAERDNVFGGWSRRASISWPERGAALDIQSEAPLDFLVLYTPSGADFFCAEPVTNVTDAFNFAADDVESSGLIVIAPGESCTVKTRFVPRLNKPN